MFPKIWIFDTYNILIFIGVMVGLLVLLGYTKKIKMESGLRYTLAMIALVSLVAGLVFAILFQSLFDLFENNTSRPFAMTFYGGLFGGGLVFILLYVFYIQRQYPSVKVMDLLIIAPGTITIAHAFGRIGCFFAGCCYGIETDSWLGVQFPGHAHPRYPTQLFEAFFLFILAGVLIYLAYQRNHKYTLPIYLLAYGVWRFLIEFIRGDDRGAFFIHLSPSQWFSIMAIIASVVIGIRIYQKTTSKNMEIAS